MTERLRLKKLKEVENEIWYSTASVLEISIKHMKHPKHIPISEQQLSKYC